MNKALLSSKKMDWRTPQAFFDKLNREFHFVLDAAAMPENAKCTQYFTPETSGFTFQHIRKGFQCTVSRTGDRSAAASVVDEGIDCLLQHTLLVTDNDIRSAKLKQAGKTVVTVDDSSV